MKNEINEDRGYDAWHEAMEAAAERKEELECQDPL